MIELTYLTLNDRLYCLLPIVTELSEEQKRFLLYLLQTPYFEGMFAKENDFPRPIHKILNRFKSEF